MNNPSGTDESAWERQWWNLRPSPMFQDWQVSVKLVTLSGFTNNVIVELVLKSPQRQQLFGLRPNGIRCFQRCCLQYDKSEIPFYISFHWTFDPWKKMEDLKRHDRFVALTQDEVTIDSLIYSTPYLARIFIFFKRNFPSPPTSSTMMHQDYAWERRIQ